MNSDEYTQKIKEVLSGYGSAEATMKKLYNNILSTNAKEYERSKAELTSQLEKSRNSAAVDSMISRRNTSQFLSGRGLTHSGESVQSELNENISLSNRLAQLDTEYGKALGDALQRKDDKDLSAQSKLYEYQSEAAIKKANVAASLYTTLLNAKLKDDKNNGSEDGDKQYYTPSSNVKDMAKNLLGSTTDDGRVTNGYENARLRSALKTFCKENNVSPEYINELEVVLRSNGYYDMDEETAQSYESAGFAKANFKRWTNYYFGEMKNSMSLSRAHDRAKAAAKDQQMCYIFTHCATEKSFRKAWELMNFDPHEIEHFYDRINKAGKLKLGMYVR